jgi:hypothetical protein
MRKVIRIDKQGYYREDVILQDHEPTPEDCVEIEVPEGFYYPKWDFVNLQWVEGLSEEEIEEIRNQPIPPNEIDVLGEKIVELELTNLDLQAQNEILGEQVVNLELRLLQFEGGGASE